MKRLFDIVLDHPLEFLIGSFVVLLLLSVTITIIGGIDTDEMLVEYGTGLEQVIFLAVWFLGAGLIVSLHLKSKYKDGTETEKMLSAEYLETFKIKECDKIILEYHRLMSDRQAQKTAEVNDSEGIKEILDLLRQIPETGDEMIKMGDVSVVKAFLYYQGNPLGYCEYYQDMLKKPDTSFCSQPPEEENRLYALLRTKLQI